VLGGESEGGEEGRGEMEKKQLERGIFLGINMMLYTSFVGLS
jgi:hypothetical protein